VKWEKWKEALMERKKVSSWAYQKVSQWDTTKVLLLDKDKVVLKVDATVTMLEICLESY